MDFFISNAFAQGGQASGGGWEALLFPVLLIVVFYFLLIRPQTKRAKEHRQLVEALAKGDEVVTSGGLLGRVIEVGETFATVEIANGVEVRLQKTAVTAVMPKGTYKNPEKKAK